MAMDLETEQNLISVLLFAGYPFSMSYLLHVD